MLVRHDLIRTLCFCVLALIAVPGLPDNQATSIPDVRALLFFNSGMPQSKELFAFYLPALYERYGGRLEVSGIDLLQPVSRRGYSEAAERLGLPPRPGEDPIVVVGDRVVVGLFNIAAALGDNFEELAEDAGARNWPSAPALDELLPGGVEAVKRRVASEEPLPTAGVTGESSDEPRLSDQIAIGLAVTVLFGMVAAFIHALVRLQRPQGMPGSGTSWLLFLTLLVGLGISAYTAYTALAEVELVCGPLGGCAEVQKSEYSKPFGIPMGVLGLIGYALILVTWLGAKYFSSRDRGWYWLPWAVALLGVLFSLGLTALEVFVIGAACLWCLGSAVSITIVFWLLSGYVCKGTRRKDTGFDPELE